MSLCLHLNTNKYMYECVYICVHLLACLLLCSISMRFVCVGRVRYLGPCGDLYGVTMFVYRVHIPKPWEGATSSSTLSPLKFSEDVV